MEVLANGERENEGGRERVSEREREKEKEMESEKPSLDMFFNYSGTTRHAQCVVWGNFIYHWSHHEVKSELRTIVFPIWCASRENRFDGAMGPPRITISNSRPGLGPMWRLKRRSHTETAMVGFIDMQARDLRSQNKWLISVSIYQMYLVWSKNVCRKLGYSSTSNNNDTRCHQELDVWIS